MSKKKEKIRDAKKYDKFDYKVGSKSELLSFAVAFIVFLVSFIPVLADFPRDILRLVCDSTDIWYGIRDDGVVVVKPRDWTCDADCKPGEVWLLEEGTWPSGEATELEDNISFMTEKE